MSYNDESYKRVPSGGGSSFFRPTPAPPSTPPARSTPPPTRRAAQASPVVVKITRPTGKINILLLMDVSGSTRAYINNLRDKAEYLYTEIIKIIPELAGKIEFSFTGVSDHCDGRLWFQPTAFSGDPAVLKNNLNSIENAGGDDEPEAYECAIKEINTWDLQDTNTIVLAVIDSVPHGIGYAGRDNGCPNGVNWKTELDALKKKIKAFYVIGCSEHVSMKRLQRLMVEENDHFIELGGNFLRLTNVVHGIIAKEFGDIDKYLARLAATRGAARANEVATLLKTRQTKI